MKRNLQNMINSIDAATHKAADSLLYSENLVSLKKFPDGYEAMILVDGEILMPLVEMDQFQNIVDCHCQCCDDNTFCVHKAAMFIGIERMLVAHCDDYHEAVTVLKEER